MRTNEVTVTQTVKVTVDETKFTPEFMAEFRANFFPFDTLEEHIEHLAQLYARGVIEGGLQNEFIEGYGRCGDMGIRFEEVRGSLETEIVT